MHCTDTGTDLGTWTEFCTGTDTGTDLGTWTEFCTGTDTGTDLGTWTDFCGPCFIAIMNVSVCSDFSVRALHIHRSEEEE